MTLRELGLDVGIAPVAHCGMSRTRTRKAIAVHGDLASPWTLLPPGRVRPSKPPTPPMTPPEGRRKPGPGVGYPRELPQGKLDVGIEPTASGLQIRCITIDAYRERVGRQ